MREIKFRAWDKHNKKWLNRVLASRYEDGPCAVVWDEDKKEWLNFDEFCGDLCQFTGLKDANEEEIFDGDILFISRNLEFPDQDGDYYLAKWECCGFQFRKIITVRNGEKKKAKPCVIISRAAIENHSEIAGNIYENHELLEAKQ